jgi:hypothetical protein
MALIVANRIKETTPTTGTGTLSLAGAATGYRPFSSVMASNDTCIYCVTDNTSWEVGIGTFAAAPTLARTMVLSSSNAGSAVSFGAGSKDIFITQAAERMTVPELTTDPAVPASGNYFYTRQLAGRFVPRWIGPSGVDTGVQPCMWGNSIALWLPGVGSTAAISFGVSWTHDGTPAHPAIAATNFMTQLRRATFTTTTTALNASGARSAAQVAWLGNAAGLGGFFFAARFGITTYQAAMRIFVGLTARNGALASDPNTMSNTCGIAKMTTSTLWQCITTNNAASVSYTSTNVTTMSAAASSVYDLYMFARQQASRITFGFVDISTNVWSVSNVDMSGILPDTATMLYAMAGCQNVTGGAGTVAAIFLTKMYVESDD